VLAPNPKQQLKIILLINSKIWKCLKCGLYSKNTEQTSKKNSTSNNRTTQSQTSKQDFHQEFVLFNKLAKSQRHLIRGVHFW